MQQRWNEQDMLVHLEDEFGPLTIPMEDPIVHTASMPFCGDPCCPCHRDQELILEYLTIPAARGLLTRAQVDWLFRGGSDA